MEEPDKPGGGAARAVGWSEAKGRRIVADQPELRRVAKKAVGTIASDVVRDWKELHADARRRIKELLSSSDHAVLLRAAIYVFERVEGKVTQPIRDETPQVSMNNVYWHFVASFHIYRNVSVAEALAYADRNPDGVEKWGRQVGLLKPLAEA